MSCDVGEVTEGLENEQSSRHFTLQYPIFVVNSEHYKLINKTFRSHKPFMGSGKLEVGYYASVR